MLPPSAVVPGGAGGRGVLHRPAAQVDRRGAGVVQLDEVTLQRCPGIAATAIDLADDHIGMGLAGQKDAGNSGGER